MTTKEPRTAMPAHMSAKVDQLAAEAVELRPWLDRMYAWAEQARDLFVEADASGVYTSADGTFIEEVHDRLGFEPVDELFADLAGGDLKWTRPDRPRV